MLDHDQTNGNIEEKAKEIQALRHHAQSWDPGFVRRDVPQAPQQ
jgi:hypothetical protein